MAHGLPWRALMTMPRQVLPGITYIVTRRCSQRQFLLRPSPMTTGIFGYLLGVAARRFGVSVHAFCVMSTHFHLVVTDTDARLPAFEQYLDSLVARALNAALGRCESFWAPSSYSAVSMTSPDDVIEKAAYVLANPVAAGLVRRGRDWPGLWSEPDQIGAGRIRFTRPERFFRAEGPMPEAVELELTVPPGFESGAQFRDRLIAALAVHEERAALAVASKGGTFLGAARVLAQKPAARATAFEPLRRLNPRIAGRDKWKRIEALLRLKEFLTSYRVAWQAMRQGVQDVIFPSGTYWLRVAFGVRCAVPG